MAIGGTYETVPSSAFNAPTYSPGRDELTSDALLEPGDVLAVTALKHIENCRPTIDRWRKQARECDRFAAGKHFSKADQEALEAEQRPTAAFNAAQKWLRFISGLERQSRLEVRFVARDPMNDQQMQASALVTKIYEWAVAQCLVGSTSVRAGGVERGFERMYHGELVTLHLSNGKQLTATPNHPMLTEVGWKAIGLLHEGDNLIGSAWIEKVRPIAMHLDHVETRLEDKVRSLRGRPAIRESAPADFHHDGIGSQVYIERTNELLGDEGFAPFAKHVPQPFFSDRIKSAKSRFSFHVAAVEATNAARAFLASMFQHLQFAAFGNRSQHIPMPLQSRAYRSSVASNPFANFLRRQALLEIQPCQLWRRDVGYWPEQFATLEDEHDGVRSTSNVGGDSLSIPSLLAVKTNNFSDLGIRPDLVRVLRIERQVGSCQVYNLRTQAGWFIAEGVVTSNCDGETARSRAFADMIRRGIGVSDVQLDRSIDASGLVVLKRIDGHEFLWDTRASAPCFSDARWMGRERQISKSEALHRWPDHRATILAQVGVSSSSSRPTESVLISEKEAVPIDGVSWPTISPGNVRVIEYQWYEEVPGIYFVDPLSGKDDWLSESEFNAYAMRLKRIGKPVDDHDRQLMREYKRIVMIGRTVVAGPQKLPGKRFTFSVLTGTWDDEDRIYRGVFNILIDPQKFLTKFANQMFEIIVRSTKGGADVETDAVENPSQFEQQRAKVGSISWVKPGHLAGIKDRVPTVVPPAAMELANWCMGMLREVTGINPEATMGQGAGDVPLVTLKQRFAAMQLLLEEEFDTLRLYLKDEARTIFDFLQFIADDRWVRVGGPYEAQAIQLAKQPFFLEYEVILDEGTRDPSIREQWWAMIEKLAPTLMRTNNFLPELLNLAPLPASYIHQLKQSMQKQSELQAQLAQEGLSAGGRGKPVGRAEVQARVAKLQAEAARAQAQALSLAEGVKNTKLKMLLERVIQKEQMAQDAALAQQTQGMEMLRGASSEATQLLLRASQEGEAGLKAHTAMEVAKLGKREGAKE